MDQEYTLSVAKPYGVPGHFTIFLYLFCDTVIRPWYIQCNKQLFVHRDIKIVYKCIQYIQITIYDTVINREAGDKVFEPGIFLFRGFLMDHQKTSK